MSKSDSLFVTDAECARRLGISLDQFKTALPAVVKEGFPLKDPLFGDLWYWPAVRTWLDRRYHLQPPDGVTAPPGLDEQEPWK
ncbi:winged helix-turn-helix domain-containing protein [Rhizobium sp. WL3]|uniref:winged helix-turn-helix domain-containing protein n=1 Tax=Rhizobium sp. WL3 TaxID=2603277 RepID=UPI0011C2065C|nr:winged helix-turn-helix domain-containing protein [Rhizobium sp. WL3]QEE47483.1 winged helix-turn-helix domain-containing protein [Rhizobium sp. WL3]